MDVPFQALVENSADAVVLIGPDGTIRFASESSARVLGYTPEERMGASGFDNIHPDDLPRARAMFADVLQRPGVPVTDECRVRHKDGEWRNIEVTLVNRLGEPLVGSIVVNYRDITARRRAEDALRASEERLRHIVEHAQDLIYYCSPEGRFTYVNPAAARVMGYEEAELIGKHFMSLIRRDYQDSAGELYVRQLMDRRPTSYFEFPTVTKSGETVWIGQHVQLVYENGAIVAVHAIARDITRQKTAEEQLRQSQKMEAVGRLARGVAHDFNNVLAAIMGSADLMLAQLNAADPAREEAESIVTAAERGASLTRQLLTFSRRQALEPKVLDLHTVVRGVEDMLVRLTGDVTIRLQTPGRSPKVRVEPGQVEQVLLNLVVNARDAMTPGGTIDVIADEISLDERGARDHPELRPGSYARLSVRDTGTGIPPEAQRHAFEPFFTTKGPSKGTGLGLSIVYGIAKEAGGTVTFSTSPKGTTFEVLLPTVDADLAEP